jgi:hypothetical protein
MSSKIKIDNLLELIDDPFYDNTEDTIVKKIIGILKEFLKPYDQGQVYSLLNEQITNTTKPDKLLKTDLIKKICVNLENNLNCPSNQIVLLLYLRGLFDIGLNKYKIMTDEQKNLKENKNFQIAYDIWINNLKNMYREAIKDNPNPDLIELYIKNIIEQDLATVKWCENLIPYCGNEVDKDLLSVQCESNNILSVLTNPCEVKDIIVDQQGKILRCCLPVDKDYLVKQLLIEDIDLIEEISSINKILLDALNPSKKRIEIQEEGLSSEQLNESSAEQSEDQSAEQNEEPSNEESSEEGEGLSEGEVVEDSKESEIIQNVKKIREIYNEGYEFAFWVLNYVKTETYKRDIAKTTIYYDRYNYYKNITNPSENDLNKIKLLATQREPVNMFMGRRYNQNKLKEFGYEVGYYSLFQANIAIYCHTPMHFNTKYQQNPDEWIDIPKNYIHLINVYAPALDVDTQPDVNLFTVLDDTPKFNLIPGKYQQIVYDVFHKIFKCAQDKKLNNVVLCGFGLTAFSELVGKQNTTASYFKALKQFMQDKSKLIEGKNIYYGWYVTEGEPTDKIKGITYISQNIPESLEKDGLNKNETLYVNAWDPWSLPGNGNFYDKSIDGAFGRSSAIAVLCWPYTNPYLTDKKYIQIDNKTNIVKNIVNLLDKKN